MRKLAWVAGLLLFSVGALAQPDGPTVLVAVDRTAEAVHEKFVLSKLVGDAADSERRWIELSGIPNGAEVTVNDAERDKALIQELESRYAGPDYTLNKSVARTFWIKPAAAGMKFLGEVEMRRRFDHLDDVLMLLRTPLPGVEIRHTSDGAIVRSNDPGFDQVLQDKLGPIFVVQRLSRTSWHVAWSLGITSKRLMAYPVDKMIRYFIGEPLNLKVTHWRDFAVFSVADPDRYQGFMAAVREAFGNEDWCTLKETSSVVLRIVRTGHTEPMKRGYDRNALDIEGDVEEIANPAVEVAETREGVWAHATNPVHNADRGAIIRAALAGRDDLVLTTRSDQSLEVALKAGAHLQPPRPPVGDEALAKAIAARAQDLHLRPVQVSAAGAERAKAVFTSDTDANLFKRDVSNIGRLSLRLVDEPEDGSVPDAPPSPGDERLPMAQGGFIWLKPGVILSGDMFAEADAEMDTEIGMAEVHLTLTDDGRELFAAATRLYVGRRIAVVVDGRVVTAPRVNEPIEGGALQITGPFTLEEAKALADLVKPSKGGIRLRIVENRTE